MRKITITPGEYYHIFNRGNQKQPIFLDARDYVRFIFLLLHFQSPLPVYNVGSSVNSFMKRQKFSSTRIDEIIAKRTVDICSFTLMPNHFHSIIYEREAGGISSYMQRVQTGYSRYFNIKYGKSGHLVQGPFRAVHIADNAQLLHVSAYIHRNQRELKKWKNREHLYQWSSYQDYVVKNRWGKLLNAQIILDQFESKEYKNFVRTSGTKEYK